MEIKLNNQTKVLTQPCTVQQLIDSVMPEKQKGIAIAINNAVIAKENWQNHILEQHDVVLIIKATQGG